MFARAYRSKILVLLMIIFALFPSMAFAEVVIDGDFNDKIIYGPNIWNIKTGEYVVQCYSASNYNAALTALGYNPYSSEFTDDVKAYLSNSSTGGSFTEFSNGFSNNNDGSGDFSVIGASFDSALMLNNQIYGSQFVYSSKYTGDLFEAAKTRVKEVLAGDVGGGSGSGSGALPNVINLSNHYHYRSYLMKNWPTGTDWDDINPKITINDSAMQQLSEYVQNYPNVYGYWRSTADIYYNRSYDAYLIMTDGNVTVTDSGDTKHLVINGNGIKVKFSGNATVDTNFSSIGTISNLTNTDKSVEAYCIWWSELATGTPVVPPTQWPEPEPTTPTEPPEVPNPPEPTTPTEPTVTVPTIPTLPPLTYPTEPTYATPDIAAILDAMAKHCVHLQDCMKNVSDDYYDSMTTYMLTLQNKDFEFFRSWFRVTLDTIRDCFDDLSVYLHSLFTWLADQMNFTFTGGDFDDSSIVWWLKQIYSKLGSGTTVRPTDPVVDPTGIGDWFDQLIKNFIAALLGLGSNVLSDVGDMVQDLTTKFPFSIPWDIAAMLALFAASPEIPVLQLPQYALTANGVTQVGMYTIDLTPYDGVMDIARSIQKVVFAFWLAWKIDFFKAILNGIVGGDK